MKDSIAEQQQRSYDRRGNDTRVADRNSVSAKNSTFRRNNIADINDNLNRVRNADLSMEVQETISNK